MVASHGRGFSGGRDYGGHDRGCGWAVAVLHVAAASPTVGPGVVALVARLDHNAKCDLKLGCCFLRSR
jgi:hypothetical protein